MNSCNILPKTRIARCRQCGSGVTIAATYIDGELFPRVALIDCDRCAGKVNKSWQTVQRRNSAHQHISRFLGQIGDHFAAAEHGRVPEELRPVLTWQPDPPQCGLIILGPPNSGKTSVAVLAASRLIRNHGGEPREAEVITGAEFAQLFLAACREKSPERRIAENRLGFLAIVDLLVIDALDRRQLSEEARVRLRQILEARTAWQHPFIITATADVLELFARFAPAGAVDETADGPTGQLNDFCAVVSMGN